MAKINISFDWKYERIPGYGKIFRPYVPIKLKTAKSGWESFDFLADSGADLTMLPFHMIKILGLKPNKLKADEATGIGGVQVKTWKTKIPIMIDIWQFEISAVFTSDNLTPLLLGRLDTLDRKFSWFFDHQKEKIIFFSAK